MEEIYINQERTKMNHTNKRYSKIELLKILVPILVAALTVFGSLVGIYVQGSRSATKIEYIVSQINDAIIPRLEKALDTLSLESKELRERIAVLEALNKVHRVRVNTSMFPSADTHVFGAPTEKKEPIKAPSRHNFPRLGKDTE
jgi:DNA polymerase sigma